MNRPEEQQGIAAGTRVCIAYIVGRIAARATNGHVYDYTIGQHFAVSGTIDGNHVSIYDHARACHFGGSMPSLYDWGTASHVQLNIVGESFSGYDFGSGTHFTGSVSGQTITFYDYGEAQHFQYSV